MNLSDPFGRMAKRQQQEYDSLSGTLREAGVTDIEQAESLIDDAKRRGKKSVTVAVLVTVILALVFPDARLVVIPLGAIFCFWVLKITTNGQKYIRRYIEEELSGKVDEDNQDGNPN